jgi:hypothetical protein
LKGFKKLGLPKAYFGRPVIVNFGRRNQMKTRRILLAIISFVLVLSAQAYWTGGGDSTNWSDVNNWSEDIVPLTAGGVNTATVNANSTVTNVNIDSATANTFVDTTSANFLSSRAQTAGETLNLTANWGDGYSAGAMWAGQSTNGTVNFNNAGGALTTTGGTYLGRSSGSSGVVNFNISGGSVGFKEVSVGCRADALADVTLSVSGGTLYLGQSDSIANGGIIGRSQHGAWETGQTTKVSISDNANVVMYDTRLGGLSGGQGTDIFEVIGSGATITSDHNFYTRQQNDNYLGDTILRFVADAGGVSAITAFDDAATYRIHEAAKLEVDISAYAGTADLLLVDFAAGRLSGAYDLANFTVTGGTATLVQDNGIGDIYLTDIVVPEPTTMALLALGGLIVSRKKKA